MMDTAETWAAGGGMKKTRFGRKLDDLTGIVLVERKESLVELHY